MSEEEPIQEPAAPVSMKEMVFPCMFLFDWRKDTFHALSQFGVFPLRNDL